MAKKDRSEELVEVVEVAEESAPQPEPVAVTPVVMVRPPRTKVYGLEQWAQLRNKPVRHLGGLRAFLGSEAGNKYTLEVWDAKMAAY